MTFELADLVTSAAVPDLHAAAATWATSMWVEAWHRECADVMPKLMWP